MNRQLETDGVPAPSDVELAAMDRKRRRPLLSFNAYTKYRCLVDRPINADREAWHEWLGINAGKRATVRMWDLWWGGFIADQDAQDLTDTQQDALV